MAAGRFSFATNTSPSETVPYVVVEADLEGPTAVVTANLHGDETTGIGVVHRLAEFLPYALQVGRVVLFPSLNPAGLRLGTRRHPAERIDPNRCFPGSPKGSPVQRYVHDLWTQIHRWEPALVVDLHTDSALAVPYVLVDRALGDEQDLVARSERFAVASGLTVVREYDLATYKKYGMERSLSGALLNRSGVCAVTVEAGPRRLVSPGAVYQALYATLGILSDGGWLDRQAPVDPSRIHGGPWRRESGPRISVEGVLTPKLEPGAKFQVGDLLGEVRSVGGEKLEVLVARRAGHLLSLPESTWVRPGAACGEVVVADEA